MGLDMYLSKKTYIGAQYDHNKVTGTIDLQKEGKQIKIDLKKVEYIEESAAYWRKANQIHKWFVDNVQNGEDDCGDYDVSREQLQKLVNLCKQAMENKDKAEDILPTTRGFFFGGTEYDEYYYNDLQNTIDQIEPLLVDEDDYNVGYVYSSSW